ncbi:putative disease resistance protein RGA1 [Carex rostrata]
MAGNLITSLLSLATNMLPSIRASVQAPSSSSPNSNNSERGRARAFEEDLERLMRTLEQIKTTLYDAEEREIRDRSVKLWLKEMKKVTYDAEDVLSEYRYEVTRVQLEARKASEVSGSHKSKKMEYIEYIVQIPDDMVDRLNKIRSRFDEIAKDREALQLRESDGARRPNNKLLRPPTGHMVDEASIFGRDAEIEEVINLLLSEKEKPFSVISIIGKGGLGKTTIAQLVYKDERVTRCFDLCGWVCVSEEFDVGRLTKATIESVPKINYNLSEFSLQGKLAETVKGKRILLVLDDLWNENQSLWELFLVPFKEAKVVSILVTTRNKKVAKVMQTTTYFSPTNLPEDSCWQLFQHYAFSGTNYTGQTLFLKRKMGREILRKCDGLPLAVKLIASLLRHETNEEDWREILESDIWELNSSNDIFPALQISYDHLPPHLKPCGFSGYVNQVLQQNLVGLRTLSIKMRKCNGDLEHEYCINNTEAMDLNSSLSECYKKCLGDFQICNLTKFLALRVLELKGFNLTRIPDSISELKHLVHLDIKCRYLKTLPLSIGLLYNLQTLILDCYSLEYLPESIGSLINLRRLIMGEGGFLDYLPHGLVNFPAIKTMQALLKVTNVAWLKDMTDLEGNLTICGVSNLKDAQRANMRNKCKLEAFNINCDPDFIGWCLDPAKSNLEIILGPEINADFSWLESLQPHPNLKKLAVGCYSSATVPRWMCDPCSLQSIKKILLDECDKIQSLPFNSLHTLKHLIIRDCHGFRVLQLEQLSSQLEKLEISGCRCLELITGLGNLDMLATLKIYEYGLIPSIETALTEPFITYVHVHRCGCTDIKIGDLHSYYKSNQLKMLTESCWQSASGFEKVLGVMPKWHTSPHHEREKV